MTRVILFWAGALSLSAAPTITAVTNTASFLRAGLPNDGLAQGSYISIFGSGLAPAGLAQRGYPLSPSDLNGVRVTLLQGSTGTNLPVVFTSPTQVGAIVRSTVQTGWATLRLTYNGEFSEVPVRIVPRTFGIFTRNQGGSGPLVGYKFAADGASTLISLWESAAPGQPAVLFGTGLGGVEVDDALPIPAAATLTNDVEVWVGGKRAQIDYAGRIPGISAIDQINFRIPADAPQGCWVGVLVRTGGVVSNGTAIPIAASGKTCSDANGFSAATLDQARANGALRYGLANLDRLIYVAGSTTYQDSVSATFRRYPLSQLELAQPLVSPGSCVFSSGPGAYVTYSSGAFSFLDAGPRMIASNSTGSLTIDQFSNRNYGYAASTGPDPVFVIPGAHTVAFPGGADVGAFTATAQRPQSFTWNQSNLGSAISRNAELEIVWTGGDPNGFVMIQALSVTSPSSGQFLTAVVDCVAPAAAGRFTIPAAVMQSLPPSAPGVMTWLVVGHASQTPFSAPGLDSGTASGGIYVRRTIAYQ